VSREAAAAGEEALKELLERRFDEVDLLVIYIDGMMFGEQHVISAVGVDRAGHKHVLGMQPGATENAAAVEDLLEQLVARGVNPEAKRLFVIDGAKALRAAIAKVFGPQHPVQRCRNHKIRNVVERLPEEQKDQVKAAMRALRGVWSCMKFELQQYWQAPWPRIARLSDSSPLTPRRPLIQQTPWLSQDPVQMRRL
jgi:putative transposase